MICSPYSSTVPSLSLSTPSFGSANGPWKKSTPIAGGLNPYPAAPSSSASPL